MRWTEAIQLTFTLLAHHSFQLRVMTPSTEGSEILALISFRKPCILGVATREKNHEIENRDMTSVISVPCLANSGQTSIRGWAVFEDTSVASSENARA